MINIKTIVTIDRTLNEYVLHENQIDLEKWELSHISDETEKAEVLRKREKIKRETRHLENKYKYPPGSLEGIHLITGDSTSLIRRLDKPDFKEILTNPENLFIVKIRQNDPMIRTSIHRAYEVTTWVHDNDDVTLVRWPKLKTKDHTKGSSKKKATN